MRKESHDRARAEYIKTHSREERLDRVWLLSGMIFFYKDGSIDGRFYRVYRAYMVLYGYKPTQVDAFCKSVKSGITCKTIHSYQRFCFDIFRSLYRYTAGLDSMEVAFEDLSMYMNHRYAPESNPQMVLRAAFREAEHALITLPRTTLSKKETVANATHSS